MTINIHPNQIGMMLGAVLSLIVFLISWPRRKAVGGNYFLAFSFSVTWWNIAGTVESFVVDPGAKILWSQIAYIGFVQTFPYLLVFTVSYIRQRKVHPSMIMGLMVIPLITLVLTWTNSLHGWVWSGYSMESIGENILIYEHGFWFWLHVVYLYSVMLTGIIILVQNIIKSPPAFRRQLLVILTGIIFPVISGTLYILGLEPVPGMDITPTGLVFTSMFFAWGLLRYQLLDLLPIARTALVDQLQDGVVVLDPKGRIVDINQAAAQLFGRDLNEILGQDIAGVSPALADLVCNAREHTRRELVPAEGSTILLDAQLSILYGETRQEVGKLLVLRDITDRKRAENELLQLSRFQELLMEISSIYINLSLETIEPAIFNSLRDMAVFVGADRAYIFTYDFEKQICTNTHEWCAEGIEPQIETLRTVPLSILPEWVETHRRGEAVNIPDLFALPEGEYRHGLEVQGIRSVLTVPLMSKDDCLGFVGFDSVRQQHAYSDNEQHVLTVFARMLVNVWLRAQVDEALHESEDRYRTLVEFSPDAIGIHSEGLIVYVNPAAVAMLHAKNAQELLGLPAMQFLHPDYHEIAVERMLRSTNDREAAPVLVEKLITLDGQMVDVEVSTTPIVYEGKAATQIILRDITERRRAEAALAASESELRALFASMQDVVMVINQQGKYLKIAPTHPDLLVKPASELIGRNLRDVFPAEEAEGFLETIKQVLETRQTGQVEYSLLIDGRSVCFETSISPIDHDSTLWVARDITERKAAGEAIHQRVQELEMLYQSGLALNQVLDPKEVWHRILHLVQEKLNWQHTVIRLYNPQDERMELLTFNQPGLNNEIIVQSTAEHFNQLISRAGEGLTGWAVKQSQTIRSGDVKSNPHYIETYPGIQSGLYTPMMLNGRVIGVIGIESEQPDAFSEADERVLQTLANQAASAFENARLFEQTHQRARELETINRISRIMRSASTQDEMLSIVLQEALAILNTSHGSIELFNKATNDLDKTLAQGWLGQITGTRSASEGIAGRVFASGEVYIAREFASDPVTSSVRRSQIRPGWGGVCLPIRTTQQTLGVMFVSVPSERELDKDEIRLLSILSEMTGAALQRMQLHEQTIHRLEQLNALRAVDQAISSSRDMQLTLNVLLINTITQLKVDAAAVLLLHPGSHQLELAAGRGFHTLLFEGVNLSNSVAGHAILEHRTSMTLDLESTLLGEYPQFETLWKAEGFTRYWCVPLKVKGEIKGVLEVYCRKPFAADPEWLEFLEALAGQAAITIDSTQLFENLQRSNLDLSLAYDATIEGWSRAMELRDHDTEGHTQRVTDLTLKLARAMQINESQLTAIRRGALLHDIGKIGIPDGILLKEGKLTDDEWTQMRRHPQLAHDMLMPIAYLKDAVYIPYCHHEKWDGTGYPQGLKGERIPLGARIFAIIDVWDALTNDRPYRQKWTAEEARKYIVEQSGRHFDPQVVDAFLKIIDTE